MTETKKKKRNTGAKGGEWERDLSKMLSLWWTHGDRDDVIWRTHGSGSRATTRSRKGLGTLGAAGDLMATDPIAEPLFAYWLAEAKRGYKLAGDNSAAINLLYWLDKQPSHKPPLLFQWWLKAEQERRIHQRHEAVIMFRRTAKMPVIMMRAEHFGDMHHYNGPFPGVTIDINYMVLEPGVIVKSHRLTFMLLEAFLDWCPPETITMLLEERTGPGPVIKPRRAIIT